MTYVVDASLAVKWLVKEPLHEAAIDLINRRAALHAPSLILAEVGNTLWKKARRGEITEHHAREAREQLTAYFDSLHPLEKLNERALDIALQLDHPVYDCFYLACAESLGMPLITADDRLIRVVQSASFASPVIHIASIVLPKA